MSDERDLIDDYVEFLRQHQGLTVSREIDVEIPVQGLSPCVLFALLLASPIELAEGVSDRLTPDGHLTLSPLLEERNSSTIRSLHDSWP